MKHLAHDWYPEALPANVRLGDGTWLYSSFAFLHCRSRRPVAVRVGKSTGIYNGSFFELGEHAEVSIGDYCALVGAIIATDSHVRIGDYCFIAHEVVIADTSFAMPALASRATMEPHKQAGSGVVVGNDVWIGANAVLLGGARIGDGAIVGAAAIVNFEVPAYAIVGGNPATVIGHAHPGRKSAVDRSRQ